MLNYQRVCETHWIQESDQSRNHLFKQHIWTWTCCIYSSFICWTQWKQTRNITKWWRWANYVILGKKALGQWAPLLVLVHVGTGQFLQPHCITIYCNPHLFDGFRRVPQNFGHVHVKPMLCCSNVGTEDMLGASPQKQRPFGVLHIG